MSRSALCHVEQEATKGDVMRRVVIGFSGGVTSSYAAVLALREYPRDEVVLLWHDTKEEDEDTLRFLRESAAHIGLPITERSDGRSVTEVARDEGFLPNNRVAFCSRILKAEQCERYFTELRSGGVTEIIKVMGFTRVEWKRIQRHTMMAQAGGFSVRFPLKEVRATKQDAADYWIRAGIALPRMYAWSEHANCLGCVRGGKAYWLAVKENAPEAWEQRVALEAEFGHTFLKDTSLVQLAATGLKRTVSQRESIEIGSCECGA